MKSDLVDVIVVLKHQTDRAVLIDHGGKKPCWLPLLQIEIAPNEDGRTHTLTMPQWLAEEKEIV
jgi:hypothetical protein